MPHVIKQFPEFIMIMNGYFKCQISCAYFLETGSQTVEYSEKNSFLS